MLLALCVRQ